MRKEEKKYYYPNTTQKPNVVFDVIMPKIGREKPLAYLVLDAMIRKIYGWGKEEDNISNSQLVEMTGLSPDSVRDSIQYLIENKFVEQIIKGHGKTISRYRLTLNEYIVNATEEMENTGSQNQPPEVAETNHSKTERLPIPRTEVANSEDRGSQNQPPEVAKTNPQNLIKPNNQNLKEKKEKEEISFLNLKDHFSEKLKSKNIEYYPNKNEHFAINKFLESGTPPEKVLELVDKLLEVRVNNPKDNFYNGICFNLSDLFSYQAKILNAYSLLKGRTDSPPPPKKDKYADAEKYGFRRAK